MNHERGFASEFSEVVIGWAPGHRKLFGACLCNSLLIPSNTGDFLDYNVLMVVSNSSILIKLTQFSVNFAHFPSVVLSLNF